MPNTGLVNGILVNGAAESFFNGNILVLRQIVQYNNTIDNIITLREKVGVQFVGQVFDILQNVLLRASAGGLTTAIIQFEQGVQFLRAAGQVIGIENVVIEDD